MSILNYGQGKKSSAFPPAGAAGEGSIAFFNGMATAKKIIVCEK